MDIHLTPVEARVLGSLMEKAATTPDSYPLSLNAVIAACNQKSNREPIMSLDQTQTLEALDGLMSKRLAREKTTSGSRVTKYVHRLSGTLGLTREFSPQELGVLCVLMLRGAQTVGEIRGRTHRLCEFQNLGEVEHTLSGLMSGEDGPYVTKLPRQPGRKEARYAHLLCGDVEPGAQEATEATPSAGAPSGDLRNRDRIAALERAMEEIRGELKEIKKRLGE
ncbi:MAG: YceH family protein [Gammaproteobacteria bacterium]|nr:YceH family protein [Gammaproteobacteria bacterium]MDH3411984.1 YceH family protein [Gammaproteobacteria bacterium]